MTRRISTYLLLALALLWGPNTVRADEFGGTGKLKLPAFKRDIGILAGGFVLKPTVALTYGYDANVFYEMDNEFEKPDGAQTLLVIPGLKIANRYTQNIRFSFDGNARIKRYLSSKDVVANHSNIGGEVGASAQFFASSPVSLELRERFRRALERRNVESDRNFNRHLNKVGASVIFAPGGGALKLRLDYNFVADLFTDTSADWGDLIYHDIKLKGMWKFFPFTAVVLDGSWQIRDYLDENRGYYGELTDSMPLKLRVGLNGFITRKLSVLALIGYGNSFHEDWTLDDAQAEQDFQEQTPNARDSFNSVLGEARVSFRFSDETILQGGYEYNFRESLFTNFVSFHKGYLNFQQRIAQRVDVTLDLAYYYLVYSQLPRTYLYNDYRDVVVEVLGRGYDRVDSRLVSRVNVDVDIARYVAFNLSYRFEILNDSLDEEAMFGVRYDDGRVDYMGYSRHLILGTFVFRY